MSWRSIINRPLSFNPTRQEAQVPACRRRLRRGEGQATGAPQNDGEQEAQDERHQSGQQADEGGRPRGGGSQEQQEGQAGRKEGTQGFRGGRQGERKNGGSREKSGGETSARKTFRREEIQTREAVTE